jgi:protein translocase SecG subunit
MDIKLEIKKFLVPLQITISCLLIAAVLLQQKGGLFKTEGRFYGTLRGLEKKIFWLTIFLGFCFIILALLNLVL